MWQERRELEIGRLRDVIDEIDGDLVDKIAQRMELSEEIAKIKAEHGLPIYVPWREQEILDKRREWGLGHGLSQEFIRDLFELIMSESKRRQRELIKAKNC